MFNYAEYDDSLREERLGEAIEQYGNEVMRVAYLYLHDKSLAEDISQEVFYRLYYAKKEFENEEHMKAWILRVTINMCKNNLKSFWKKNVIMSDHSEILSHQEEESQTEEELSEAISKLSFHYKSVIILYYYQGYDTFSIAKMFSTSHSTIRSRLKRAREKLKLDILHSDTE